MIVVNGSAIDSVYLRTVYENGSSFSTLFDSVFVDGEEVWTSVNKTWKAIYASNNIIINDTGSDAIFNIASLVNSNATDCRLTFTAGYCDENGFDSTTINEGSNVPFSTNWKSLSFMGGETKIRIYNGKVQVSIPYNSYNGMNLGIRISLLEEYS